MTSKFLSNVGSNANLSNGSADLYVNSVGIAGLTQTGKPLTLSASKHVQAGNIGQDSVTNLQNDLTTKNELSYTKSDAHGNPPAGQIKTYFKTDGDFYKKDEAGTETKVAGSGTGDVVGPAVSVDNTIPRFNATTGKIIKGSGVTIDDSNNITTPGYISATSGGISGTLSTNTVQPITTNNFDIGAAALRYNNIYGNNFVNALGNNIDVSSEVSSNNVNQVVAFSGTDTSGKKIRNTGVTIDSGNNMIGLFNCTMFGLTTSQNLNVNNLINCGDINNVGTITTKQIRCNTDNLTDIGDNTKQIKDIYIKGDIKYNKAFQNIQLGINAGGTTQGVGCVDNISIGQGSNPVLTTGDNNISLGKDSGKVINTGLANICLGPSSGGNIESGISNICLGNNSGQVISTGSNNIFIGNTTTGSATLSNAMALGYNVTNDVTNSAVIGNTDYVNIRPSAQRSCDLGTTTRNFKDIYSDKVILHTQAQSNRYYNNNGSAGIGIANTPAANVQLTGSAYNGGTADRVFTVAADGTMKLSNAIIDASGNLTASNTTLASLQLQNNLTFNADNSHDLGTVATAARSIYYKTNLSGNTATFSGNINTLNILPSTTAVSDLGSNTLKYKDLYLSGGIIGMPYDFIFAATDEVNTITTTGQKMSVRVSRSFQTSKIKVSVNSAGGAGFVVDIKNNGVLVQSIAQGTSLITNTVNTQSYTEDNTITCEVSNVGAGTATGLKVYLIGKTI